MTPFPHSVQIDSSVGEAAALMRHHRFHHLPLADGDSIVGLITAADIANWGASATVREHQMPNAYIVELVTPLDEVLFNMAERHIDCAIVTRHGKLAGIFTHIDAYRTFAAHLRALYAPPPEDEVA